MVVNLENEKIFGSPLTEELYHQAVASDPPEESAVALLEALLNVMAIDLKKSKKQTIEFLFLAIVDWPMWSKLEEEKTPTTTY